MSYDIRVWCAAKPHIPASLPSAEKWAVRSTTNVAYEGRGWQIVCWISRVDFEDVPDSISDALPGIEWMVELSLEPISAPKGAHPLLLRSAKAIAQAAHGAIENPQVGTIALPSGVRRFMSSTRGAECRLLQMSWWTNTNVLRDPASLDRLIDVLKKTLPEALPRRYGWSEPPQYSLAADGEAHFRDLLQRNDPNSAGVICYPTRPVVAFYLAKGHAPGITRMGYHANYLSIGAEASSLAQPGWQKQFRRAWESISSVVMPFYGDVRILDGYELRGGMLLCPRGAAQHPVKSWWWRGIPEEPPLAIVLGEPYLSLWPIESSHMHDGLAFASVEDWGEASSLQSIVGMPPDELIQPKEFDFDIHQGPRPGPFASIFPFKTSSD